MRGIAVDGEGTGHTRLKAGLRFLQPPVMIWTGPFGNPAMNTYHCMIDLKPGANPLVFAHALDAWLSLLRDQGLIVRWRLLRRKLNLAGDECADFLLEIELTDLSQLDAAFHFLGRADDEAVQRYDQMHQHIAHADFGLYRPFPDPERVERLALI
jgi:hypothetical protein